MEVIQNNKVNAFITDLTERELLMAVRIRKAINGDIEVSDTVGIRIFLLNEKKDIGLWTYFNIRLSRMRSN